MKKITLAVPKGRILQDLLPLFEKINLQPEPDFFNDNSRKLFFATNLENLEIIKVRSFDVATFVKFGGADLGICGFDVLSEFPSKQVFLMLDLKIGKCRLSIAGKKNSQLNLAQATSLRIATKYVNITSDYFSQKGIQAEIVKLSGSVEIASWLNLADFIVDLVSTGKTLLENNMQEIATILEVSSCLIVNRTAFKVNNFNLNNIIARFNEISV
jgi:ATP phosphoribosyltransferase